MTRGSQDGGGLPPKYGEARNKHVTRPTNRFAYRSADVRASAAMYF